MQFCVYLIGGATSLIIANLIFTPNPFPIFLTSDSRPHNETPIPQVKFTEIRTNILQMHPEGQKLSAEQRSLLYNTIKEDNEVSDPIVKALLVRIKKIANDVLRNPLLSATMQKFMELVEHS